MLVRIAADAARPMADHPPRKINGVDVKTTTSPGPQTRCSLPRRNSIFPLSIHTICSFAWLCGSTWTPAPMPPPYDHSLVAGENAALVADPLLG